MQLANQRIGNAVVLAAAGRIDHASAESFKEALQPYLARCQADGEVVVIYEDAASAHDPFAKAATPDYSGPVDTWQVGGVGVGPGHQARAQRELRAHPGPQLHTFRHFGPAHRRLIPVLRAPLLRPVGSLG
jgi:hypothetical protein